MAKAKSAVYSNSQQQTLKVQHALAGVSFVGLPLPEEKIRKVKHTKFRTLIFSFFGPIIGDVLLLSFLGSVCFKR
jgi:hypothetical protein